MTAFYEKDGWIVERDGDDISVEGPVVTTDGATHNVLVVRTVRSFRELLAEYDWEYGHLIAAICANRLDRLDRGPCRHVDIGGRTLCSPTA